MNIKTTLLIILISVSSFANDGAYYASGNQLIPITETEICITKEILTVLRKIENDESYVYVTVDYTFFNPGQEKTILVGFEAPSPSGDVNGYPKNGAHPYISKFDVLMNNGLIPFKTAIVNSENYYVNNTIDSKTEDDVIGEDFNANDPSFYYVYHFEAKFKPGINTVKHTYRFNMSGSMMEKYNFDYILTAANRWGNNQIDDFTLHIDMGANENFILTNSFFKDKKEWTIDDGRSINYTSDYRDGLYSKFITYTGGITFKKTNFKPTDELYIHAPVTYMKENYTSFDYKSHNLPELISLENDEHPTCTKSVDETSFKILRNLPFALHGYVFETTVIQEFYLSQNWYKPNPEYQAKIETLKDVEKEWLEKVTSNKWDN
ncbi:YARHG domain-containing protein [Psychroserpens sp. NJDZ02]|uniref:YARHG domain-containing protein n=1 Tax=Psychroserpens sp. NJDZ02 TaxID=2570561 RepID=UPI0010A9131D|nr:YARHG domain-containing protein [Psychroserpens sp. NJDZ02]QCE42739.1 YARHG domain-containing protein [Psychroserpens sp. NJDZ02]